MCYHRPAVFMILFKKHISNTHTHTHTQSVYLFITHTVFCLHVCLHARRGHEISTTMWLLWLNSGRLEEQSVLLTTEPSESTLDCLSTWVCHELKFLKSYAMLFLLLGEWPFMKCLSWLLIMVTKVAQLGRLAYGFGWCLGLSSVVVYLPLPVCVWLCEVSLCCFLIPWVG